MAPIRVLPLLLLLILAACAAGQHPATASDLTGRVVAIQDGDTLTLLTAAREQVRVRLVEIDAPEARQPWGNRARQALSEMAFGRSARIEVLDTDRYGRTVGRVWVGGLDVNREMVRQGHAWVYRQYLRDRTLLAVEREARDARRGLWGLPEAERIPPWAWRRQRR